MRVKFLEEAVNIMEIPKNADACRFMQDAFPEVDALYYNEISAVDDIVAAWRSKMRIPPLAVFHKDWCALGCVTGPSSKFTDDVFLIVVLFSLSNDEGLFIEDYTKTRPVTYSEQTVKKLERTLKDSMKRFSMCPSIEKAKDIAWDIRGLRKLGAKQ